MQFKILSKADFELYNELVNQSTHSTLYHTLSYLHFASDLLDTHVEVLAGWQNEQLVIACPWLVKDGALGKVYNSLAYYGANGGVIYKQAEYIAPFIAEMEVYLKQDAAGYTQISNPFDQQLLTDSDFTQNRVAQITHLTDQSEENKVLELFHSKTRNMIRKGLKEDLSIQVAKNKEFLASTHQQNMNAVGVTPKGEAFFERLNKHFIQGEDYQIFEALIEGVKAAAVLVFYHHKTVEYYMPAIHIEYRNRQAMSALILKVMQDSIDKGYAIWNWGGTPLSNENLYRFKSRFGAIDKPYTIQGKVLDKSLLSNTIQVVSEAYPGMFVVPFDMLTE